MNQLNWTGIGGMLAAGFAVLGMVVALVMMGDAFKGRMKKIATVSVCVLIAAIVFAVSYSGNLFGIGDAVAGWFGVGGGGAVPAPGFAPGGGVPADPTTPARR